MNTENNYGRRSFLFAMLGAGAALISASVPGGLKRPGQSRGSVSTFPKKPDKIFTSTQEPGFPQNPEYKIVLTKTDGSRVFCSDNYAVGFTDQSPAGAASCDAFFPRNIIAEITINGKPLVLPSSSKGVFLNRLAPQK